MQEQSLKFPITRAVLYPQSAGITRAAEVTFKKGSNRLIIPDLPQHITPDSIRIEPDPAAGLKILEVTAEEKLLDPYDANLYRRTREQVNQLQQRSSKLAASFKTYTDEFLLFVNKQNLGDTLPPGAAHPLVAENWQAFLQFLEGKLEENRSQTRQLLFQWLELQRELETAQGNLQQYTSYEKKREHRIITLLEAPGEVTGLIRIHYLQPGVSWHPAYRIRAHLAESELEFALYAMVSQKTGEDWKDIQLELSTAIPRLSCDIPKVLTRMIREKSATVLLHTAEEANASLEMDADECEDVAKADTMTKRKLSKKISSPRAPMRHSKSMAGGMGGMADRELLSNMDEKYAPAMASPPPAPHLASPKAKRSEEKSRPREAGEEFLQELLQQAEMTLNRGLNLEALPSRYQELFHFMCLDYVPEQMVPATPSGRVNKHFARGTSPLDSLGGYDYRYPVSSARNRISASGLPVQLDIEARRMPMQLQYITIPYCRESVFLKARFRNTGASPFPAGPAQIFVENTFLANIGLETLAGNQGTAISLGIEKDIIVKRQETSQRKTSGLMSKEIYTEFQIEIELTSYKEEPLSLIVYDRLPVSEQKKELAVLETSYTPAPRKILEESVLEWQLELRKGQKTLIKFSYTIKQPENYRLELHEGSYKLEL